MKPRRNTRRASTSWRQSCCVWSIEQSGYGSGYSAPWLLHLSAASFIARWYRETKVEIDRIKSHIGLYHSCTFEKPCLSRDHIQYKDVALPKYGSNYQPLSVGQSPVDPVKPRVEYSTANTYSTSFGLGNITSISCLYYHHLLYST